MGNQSVPQNLHFNCDLYFGLFSDVGDRYAATLFKCRYSDFGIFPVDIVIEFCKIGLAE